jgi:hypothetical protein
MANGVFVPQPIQKSKYIWLKEGIVYGNYGTDNYQIGVTRGGSNFQLMKTVKEINFDGAYGVVKNMRRVTKCEGILEINFLKLTYTNLAYGLNMDVSDGTDSDGTYKEYSFRVGYESTDVLTNIAYVGQKFDGSNCIIFINNALNVGGIKFDLKTQDEVVCPMLYKGFYSYSSPTTVPVEIWDYDVA